MKLTVQDLLGDYRLATAQEILTAADHVINRRFRRGVALRSALDSKDLFLAQACVTRTRSLCGAVSR